MSKFVFEIGDQVRLKASAESGEVIGRAEHKDCCNQYRVVYLAGDGRQVECWWEEYALIAVQ